MNQINRPSDEQDQPNEPNKLNKPDELLPIRLPQDSSGAILVCLVDLVSLVHLVEQINYEIG